MTIDILPFACNLFHKASYSSHLLKSVPLIKLLSRSQHLVTVEEQVSLFLDKVPVHSSSKSLPQAVERMPNQCKFSTTANIEKREEKLNSPTETWTKEMKMAPVKENAMAPKHSAFIPDMRKVHHNCIEIAFSTTRWAEMRSLVMPFLVRGGKQVVSGLGASGDYIHRGQIGNSWNFMMPVTFHFSKSISRSLFTG